MLWEDSMLQQQQQEQEQEVEEEEESQAQNFPAEKITIT
jgi:hypothetical protein